MPSGWQRLRALGLSDFFGGAKRESQAVGSGVSHRGRTLLGIVLIVDSLCGA